MAAVDYCCLTAFRVSDFSNYEVPLRIPSLIHSSCVAHADPELGRVAHVYHTSLREGLSIHGLHSATDSEKLMNDAHYLVC